MAQHIIITHFSDNPSGHDASNSAHDDEAKDPESFKEAPTVADPHRKAEGRKTKSRHFLEDESDLRFSPEIKELKKPLLAKKNSKKVRPSKTKQKQIRKSNQPIELENTKSKTEVSFSKSKLETSAPIKEVSEKKEDAISLELDGKTVTAVDTKGKEVTPPKSEHAEDEDEDDEEGEDYDENENEKNNDFIRAKKILRDVFPTFLFSVIQLVQETIVLQFIGHYCNSTDFAAVGNLWVNITGYVMIYGFTSALATLGSHESGKGNSKEIGVQLHQCVAVTLILSGIALLLNVYVEEILIFAGQPESVAKIVPTYTWPLAIGLLPYSLISSFVNYLEAQQVYDPPSYSTLLSFLFHPLLCWLFIGVFEWGVFGGGLALCIVNILDIIFLIGIVRFRPVYWDEIKDSIFWPSKDSLKGFTTILKVGCSAMVLTCVEWWALEYTTMFAGWYGEDKLSAHTICLQIENIICMIASSFGLIIQTYSGNALGELNKRDFLSICRLGPLLGFICTGIFMALIVILRDFVPKLFTSSPEVVPLASQLILFNITYGIFDTAQCLFGSILKGIGKYQVAIWSSIIPYYFIGIPLSWYFASNFKNYEIQGIWVGITIGIIMINVIYVYILSKANLKTEMDKFEEQEEKEERSDAKKSNKSSIAHPDLVEVFLEKRKKREARIAEVLSKNRAKGDYRQRKLGRL